MSKITFDLKSKDIWDNLSNGLHTVSVVAQATGYEDSDKAFYNFVKEPNTPMINIQLYQCTAERNRVNKTDYMKLVGSLFGTLRDEASITSPDILAEGKTLPTFNYVYIREFNRYYYVTELTSVRNGLWDISLDVDVLMTYNTAIRGCTAYVDRNENSYNKKVIDTKVPLQQGEIVDEVFISNQLFDGRPTQIGSHTDGRFGFIIQGVNVGTGDLVDKNGKIIDRRSN